jgi:hypothetical protein
VINHTAFPTSVAEAVVLLPAVRSQFQVNACATSFIVCDPEIDSADFSSLQIIFSGVGVVLQQSHQISLIFLSRQLYNVGLERFFFGLWDASTADAAVTLSTSFATRSLLSVDALDCLLSSESFVVTLQHLPFFATSIGHLRVRQQSLTFVTIPRCAIPQNPVRSHWELSF